MDETGTADRRAQVQRAVRQRVSVDARALGALRLALGMLVVADVVLRSRNLVAFYTDAGAFPRAILRSAYPARSQLSLHALSGDVGLQALLFFLTALAGLALLVGYRTRLATVVCLVLVVSMHARNPLVLDAGDKLLRRLLFWGVFLPLGARYAIDDVDVETEDGRVASLATAGLLLQVVLVYVVNAVFKLRGDVWPGGEAVAIVFRMDHYTVFLGNALEGYTTLLAVLTWTWLGLLLVSPLLVLATGRLRSLVAGGLIGAHLGMALTLMLGIFPLVSVTSLLVFLHPGVWDWLENATRRVDLRGRRPTIPGQQRLLNRARKIDASVPTAGDLPSDVRWVARRVATLFLVAAIVAMLVWNAVALGVVSPGGEAGSVAREATWDMFAPSPPERMGWFVVPGDLESGERVDAFRGGPLAWEQPDDVAATYPSDRWRKFLHRTRGPDHLETREALAGFLCRSWNRSHDDELVGLEMYYLWRSTGDDPPTEPQRVPLGAFECASPGQN